MVVAIDLSTCFASSVNYTRQFLDQAISIRLSCTFQNKYLQVIHGNKGDVCVKRQKLKTCYGSELQLEITIYNHGVISKGLVRHLHH